MNDFSERQEILDAEEQPKNSKVPPHLLPHVFKKGQSGNPGGRPVGSVSMKTYVKNMLLSMTEEERLEFLEGIDKKVLWEMAEGKPDAKNDINATVEIKAITGMRIEKE